MSASTPLDQQNAVLFAVGALLGREIDLDDLLRILVDRIVVAMEADRGTLYLVDAARQELFSKVAHLPELKEIRLKLGQGIAGHVAMTGEVVNVSATAKEQRFFKQIDRQTGYHSRTLLSAPMRDHRGRIIGVVQLLNKKGGDFTPADEKSLLELAAQAAMALEATSLYRELRRAETATHPPLSYQYNRIIGESEAMQAVYRATHKAASTAATVLIRGESGTGKELIARAIHVNSPRRDKPFVKVDCAALPAGLIENELFGHEKGAFTGAVQRTLGRFEAANGGTVFIDELGELPLAVQGRLLRVLQERAFERVGGTETVKVDVRIIAATNRDLEWMVQEGRFRADLYYRIRVVEVALPPLRERGESDIRRLVAHFVSAAARRHGLREPQLTEAAIRRLVAHSWPGNVRELENCIESAVVLVEGEVLDADTLPLPARSVAPVPSQRLRPESSLEPFDSSVPAPLERPAVPVRASGSWARPKPAAASELEADLSRADLSLAEVERRHILKVLDVAAQNRTVAARLLGIGRNTLIRKLKDFGFQEDGDG